MSTLQTTSTITITSMDGIGAIEGCLDPHECTWGWFWEFGRKCLVRYHHCTNTTLSSATPAYFNFFYSTYSFLKKCVRRVEVNRHIPDTLFLKLPHILWHHLTTVRNRFSYVLSLVVLSNTFGMSGTRFLQVQLAPTQRPSQYPYWPYHVKAKRW